MVGWPRMVAQGTLGVRRGQERRPGIPERREHRVTFGAEHSTAVNGHGPPDEVTLREEQLGVRPAELLDEPGRAFDVGEQERDRPRR